MVTANERMDVPAGGVNGTAARVRLSDALPVPPQFTVQGVLEPLHDVRAKTVASNPNTAHRLEFMHVPLTELGSIGTSQERLEFPTPLYTAAPSRFHGNKQVAQLLTPVPRAIVGIRMCYRCLFEL